MLNLPHLNLLDVLQGSLLVQWRIARSHHLHTLLKLDLTSYFFHLLAFLTVVFDCAASFVVHFSWDIEVLQSGQGNSLLSLLLDSEHL